MKSSGQQPKGDKDWRTDTATFAELAERAGKRAVKQAIAEHHGAGDPVVIWRDGGIVWLYPDGSTHPHVPGEEPPR